MKMYSVRAASIATGVSESRLRTWERRHGTPKPARASGRRLYDEDDLSVIRRMKQAADAGMPLAMAAVSAKAEGSETTKQPPVPEDPRVQDLLRASLEFDEASMARIITGGQPTGWLETLELVALPALDRIGMDWAENKIGCTVEHFAIEVIRGLLSRAMSALPVGSPGAPRIMTVCPEAERHDVGLLALSVLLREQGVRVLYLGADVPTHDLLITAKELQIDAVCLSATTPSGAASLGRAARSIAAQRQIRALFVGGPAFRRSSTTDDVLGVRLPQGLGAAADTIVEILRSRKTNRVETGGHGGHVKRLL